MKRVQTSSRSGFDSGIRNLGGSILSLSGRNRCSGTMSSRFSSRYGAAGPSGGIHHDSPFWILLVLAGKKPQLVHEALSLGTFSGHLPSFLALLFSHFIYSDIICGNNEGVAPWKLLLSIVGSRWIFSVFHAFVLQNWRVVFGLYSVPFTLFFLYFGA